MGWLRSAEALGAQASGRRAARCDFYKRTRDPVDQDGPDLLYFDDTLLPLGGTEMSLGAYTIIAVPPGTGGRPIVC